MGDENALTRSLQELNLYESRTIEGIFELKTAPCKSPNLALTVSSGSTILGKTTKKRTLVRCAALGAEVHGLREEQLMQTLRVCL